MASSGKSHAQGSCIILGGGRGERLYPLTKERAKPAVPFGGKYRLVDIPISSCIHSGFNQIYVLTQYSSTSLHRHIANTYIFDSFTLGFVEVLAAEQTYEHSSWYMGTADAVRKNFMHFRPQDPDYYIILSGRPAVPHGPARVLPQPPGDRRRGERGGHPGDPGAGRRTWASWRWTPAAGSCNSWKSRRRARTSRACASPPP